jgi:hypothetical protein
MTDGRNGIPRRRPRRFPPVWKTTWTTIRLPKGIVVQIGTEWR